MLLRICIISISLLLTSCLLLPPVKLPLNPLRGSFQYFILNGQCVRSMFDIEHGEIFGYAEVEMDYTKCLEPLLICYDTASHASLEGWIKQTYDQYTGGENANIR